MTTPSLIKKGSLVFVRVWPKYLFTSSNGTTLRIGEPIGWQAYGYEEISHFFYRNVGYVNNDNAIVLDNEVDLPIGGMLVDHGTWKVEKNYATFTIARFYRILAGYKNTSLWFPESDVSPMSKEAYEDFLKRQKEIEERHQQQEKINVVP